MRKDYRGRKSSLGFLSVVLAFMFAVICHDLSVLTGLLCGAAQEEWEGLITRRFNGAVDEVLRLQRQSFCFTVFFTCPLTTLG